MGACRGSFMDHVQRTGLVSVRYRNIMNTVLTRSILALL